MTILGLFLRRNSGQAAKRFEEKIYDKFLEKGNRFVILLARSRDLIHKGVKKNCRLLASVLPCPHETVIIKYEERKEEKNNGLLQRPPRKTSRK